MIHKALTPIIALLLLPLLAHAQARPEFPRSVTAPGIGLPGQSVLFQRHPDAPAAMASLRGVRIGVTGLEYLSGSEDPWNVSGESLFAVYPVPLLAMAFGGSVDLLRGDGWSAGRLNAAVGAQFTRTMYWGASYSYITSPTHEGTNGAGSFTLSLRWQPHRWFGLSWQGESLFMERIDGIPQERIHRVGALLGEQNQLWATFNFGERRKDMALEAGFRLMPLRGLYIWGSAGYASRDRLYYLPGTPPTSITPDGPEGWYATAGLTLSLGRLAWSMGGGGPDASMGFSLVWDERALLKSIIPDPDYAIMLDFSKSWSEKVHYSLVRYAQRCLATSECKGVVIKASDDHIGWAWAMEWSRLISTLRASGRKVLVYGYNFSNAMYAIAAAANKIVIYPGGSISLRGLSMSKLFFAEGFSKLGVSAQFVRFSRFKSAPESFMQRSPSKENLATMSRILKMIERNFRSMILKRSGLTVKRLISLYDETSINPVEAVKAGLVDALRYPDQMDLEAARMFRRRLPLFDPSGIKREPHAFGTNGVAVLLLEGEIVVKSSLSGYLMGSSRKLVLKKVNRALSMAMADPKIKAVVLRINSPGGSALASDVLWRTVSRLNHIKPVVVSFGNYATSGGYYMAAPARRILAEGTTITGSIGIFGGKFSVADLLVKLGVGITTVKRAPHADMGSTYRAYTPAELLKLRKSLQYSYIRFLSAVAKGRRLPLKGMEKLAGGRLWSGEEAKKRRLVDAIGGMAEAMKEARLLGRLPKGSPFYVIYPTPPSLVNRLLKSKLGITLPGSESKGSVVKAATGAAASVLTKVIKLKLPASLLEQGPWARTPWTLEIK